jgi:hypothetical protein
MRQESTMATHYVLKNNIGRDWPTEGTLISKHRTLAGAIRAEQALQRGCRRHNGQNTWVDASIIAQEGSNPRMRRVLTDAEREQYASIRLTE